MQYWECYLPTQKHWGDFYQPDSGMGNFCRRVVHLQNELFPNSSSSAAGVLCISVTVKKEMHALLGKIQFLSLLVLTTSMGRFKLENTGFRSKIWGLKPISQGNWPTLGGLPVQCSVVRQPSDWLLFISTCASCSVMLMEIFPQTEQNEYVKSGILDNHHT